MIDEHRHAVSVDDDLAVADAKQIGEGPAFVAVVAFGLGDALAGVFQDASAFGYVFQRKTAGGMNVRGANDEARQVSHLPLVCIAV